jgi:hypothetical protein
MGFGMYNFCRILTAELKLLKGAPPALCAGLSRNPVFIRMLRPPEFLEQTFKN